MAEIDLSEVPRQREGLDLIKVGLSKEETFIVSRIDGRSTLGQVAATVPKAVEDTVRVVQRLAEAGVVQFGVKPDPLRVPTPAESDKKGDYGRFRFPAPLMQAKCDLTEDERKRIIFFAAHLGSWTYYELLQIKTTADEHAIKQAFRGMSFQWYPDRFVQKDLGPFRPMLYEVWREMKRARDLLCDVKKRRAYDRVNLKNAKEDEIAIRLDALRKEDREAVRRAERIKRRKQRNPFLRRKKNAKGHFQDALAAKEDGALVEAFNLAQTAQMFDDRPEYRELAQELKAKAGEERVGPILHQGAAQEKLTRYNEAIRTFAEAVRLAPGNGKAHLGLAYNLLMAGRPAAKAERHVRLAVELLPEDPKTHYVQGRWYEAKEMKKSAIRAYRQALRLKPNYTEAKRRLRALWWGLG